jgi:uncharacterized ion transporter superfamily protein YfcC
MAYPFYIYIFYFSRLLTITSMFNESAVIIIIIIVIIIIKLSYFVFVCVLLIVLSSYSCQICNWPLGC